MLSQYILFIIYLFAIYVDTQQLNYPFLYIYRKADNRMVIIEIFIRF